MKNNANLFKKYIQERSTKEQKPFAGLAQDLKITYRTSSATGNDIMELLQQLASGAEADTLDGLKTRLVRLDKLREFLLQSELQGQEQKTVYTAYTKVQTAIRKRKDEYSKKHTLLKDILKDAGSNLAQAAFSASEDIPQLRIAMIIGGGLFKYVKKAQEERKQKLDERNKELKKDSELYYERELLRGKNTRSQKGKLKRTPNTYKDPFAGMQNPMVHEGMAEDYGNTGAETTNRGGSRKNKSGTSNDRLIRQIADDVRVVANYYKGKLIRDKDERMDKLEGDRERSRTMFMGRDRDGYSGKESSAGSNFFDRWMPAILGPGIWGAIKGIPALIKGLPRVLKSLPKILKAAPLAILSGVDKIGDFLDPNKIAGLPGKAMDWVKSLPGKGMKGISNWWNEVPAAGTQKVYNGPIRDPKTGRFVSATEKATASIEKSATKEVAQSAAKGGAKSFLKKLPGVGLLIGGGLALGRAMDGDWTGAGLEAASGLASTVPGYGTAASIGIDGAIIARDSGLLSNFNPLGVTEANASQFGPEEQGRKQLIKDTLKTQEKNDPSSTPAAIVPIAKIGRTSDLKDILQSDSNGLGFLFSLKGINTRDLVNAVLGSEEVSGPSGDSGSGGGGGAESTSNKSGGGSSTTKEDNSSAASLGGGLRREKRQAGPPPAPGQTETEQFMQAIGMAETGKGGKPMDDPSRFIRTKGGADSSAYGPYQITQDLAQRALKNTDWIDDPEVAKWMKERFIPQGKKMLKSSYSDPKYGAGGQGDLNTDYDREMYMKMSKSLMSGTLRDAGGDPLEAAADWRFGERSSARDLAARDPRYYNEVSKSMQQQKQALAQSNLEAQAKPTENILGENKKPTLNDANQTAREKAIEEWHMSGDKNKGDLNTHLKEKGLLGDNLVHSGSGKKLSREDFLKEKAALAKGPQADPELHKMFDAVGKEGTDYVIDPENGERHYFDAEAKQQMSKLTPAAPEPQMSDAAKSVTEKSAKIAAAQAAPAPASSSMVVNNVSNSSGASPSSEKNEGSGVAKWHSSWEKANDIEMA